MSLAGVLAVSMTSAKVVDDYLILIFTIHCEGPRRPVRLRFGTFDFDEALHLRTLGTGSTAKKKCPYLHLLVPRQNPGLARPQRSLVHKIFRSLYRYLSNKLGS